MNANVAHLQRGSRAVFVMGTVAFGHWLFLLANMHCILGTAIAYENRNGYAFLHIPKLEETSPHWCPVENPYPADRLLWRRYEPKLERVELPRIRIEANGETGHPHDDIAEDFYRPTGKGATR